MTYAEALEYIHGRERMGAKLGLDRIKKLLEILGDPQKELRFVHIAGTNGKGSVTSMVGSILRAAGVKTGVYISPYIERFNERMSIDGELIPDDELAEITAEVKLACDMMEREMGMYVTEFEIITAVAMLYYRRNGCGFVSLEVGLGGRLDATNSIDSPDVAVITSVSLDHTSILGDNVAAIAGEKCGIIKPGSTVVSYPSQDPEAARVIAEAAEKNGCLLVVPKVSEVTVWSRSVAGTRFSYRGIELHCPLPGAHQVENCITAVEAALELRRRGIPVSDDAIHKGVAETRFIGRFEVLSENPLVILDGAHNVSGVKTLEAAVKSLIPERELTVVMGMVSDKDHAVCIPMMASLARTFFAVAPDTMRAEPAENVAEYARGYAGEVFVRESLESALDEALALQGKNTALVVCGSLYLLGDARIYLRGRLGS